MADARLRTSSWETGNAKHQACAAAALKISPATVHRDLILAQALALPRTGSGRCLDAGAGENEDEDEVPDPMKLSIPPGPFKAYLFDCDGTIADSMPLHYIAWKKALGEWNCEFDETLFYAWGGMPIVKIISTLNEKHSLSMPVEAVAHRKESLYFDLLPQLKAVPEVLEHIEAQHGRIPLAVVSGSTRESVEASLSTLKLLDKFDALVCAGEYKKSKPDPEAFLLAAAKLRVEPKTCLVFEDTEMGIQAATAAGMASVKVPLPWERSS
jgi:beta-phosphoglucomutase family hydrolase